MIFTMPADEEGAVRLPDGRMMAWAAFGPPDGEPVVFVPGAGCGRLMTFGADLLTVRGVRLVVVDRPGLGLSDLDPTATLSSVGRDLRHLTEQVGTSRPVMVANSQGAPFALAAALVDAVSGLLLVSPSDEIASPALEPLLAEEIRAFVRRVRLDPIGTERWLAGIDAVAMMTMVLSTPASSDQAIYGDPAFRRLYGAALTAALEPGSAGYAQHTRLVSSEWSLPLHEIDIPVQVWFGAADTTHSPDLGATLTSRIPGAARQVTPNVGGSLLWRDAAQVLDAAIALANRRGGG